VTEWQSADERNNREKINRARQAAEDLFKPTQQDTVADLPKSAPDGAPADQQQPRRQPRIFAVPPRLPVSAEVKTPTEPKRVRRRTMISRKAGRVPSSQAGRIRALASYGMTRAQVAELYGVTVDEIERVINGSVSLGKSR
jgi:hypothetical protein